MLSIKSFVISGAVALTVGFLCGYSVRDDRAEIERLNFVQSALEEENQNLIRQLEVEHEYQEAAQAVAIKTQEDLDDLESRYADAINELNNLQLQYLDTSTSETALSEDADTTSPVPQKGCECSGKDKAAFQRLLNEQMIMSKDCDINTTYLNNLIEWYGSISR